MDERQIAIDNFLRGVDDAAGTMGISPHELKALLIVLSGCVCLTGRNHPNIIPPALQESLNSMFSIYGNRALRSPTAAVLTDLRAQLHWEGHYDQFAYSNKTIFRATRFMRDGPIKELEPRYFFEMLYQRLREEEYGIDAVKCRLASQLATELNAEPESILDYSLYSGDLPVMVTTRYRALPELRCSELPGDDFLVRLRMAVHGMKVGLVRPKKQYAELLLLSLPFPESAPAETKATRTTATLSALFEAQVTFDLAVVAVHSSELASGDDAKIVRQHIVQQGLLLAVIHLGPLDRSNPKSAGTSLWVLSGKGPMGRPDVLFVNAARLIDEDAESAGEYAMASIGELIRLWGLGYGMSFSLSHRENLGHLRGYFSRYFGDGYRDVLEFCKSVPRREIERSGWSLLKVRNRSKVKPQNVHFQKINSVQLEELLENFLRRSKPKPVFIIGNNGAGKSALLLQLAKTMSDKQIPTIGIAFGHRDRFPFAKTKETSLFRYLGARTTETSITDAKTAGLLVRLTKIVQTDQRRLDTFQRVLISIGFEGDLFIRPRDMEGRGAVSGARLKNLTHRLLPDAQRNTDLYNNVSISETTLGFKRHNSKHDVIGISELSSGEQQLLTLAIKLCATANEGLLFLVDEPENSLHVAWQRAIPRMLEIVCTNLGCSVAVATHSPVVISSALEDHLDCFIARDWVLQKIEHTNQQSVDAVLFDNFETYTPHTRRVAERCAHLVADTIRRVNSASGDAGDARTAVNALSEVRAIVSASAESLPGSLARGDLELLNRARQAIEELLGTTTG